MTKELQDILIEILKEHEEHVPEWHNLTVRKIGYEVLKKHFSHEIDEYSTFYADIESDSEKLKKFNKVIRFYYFWCKRPSVNKALHAAFKLIVMFSIMEYLMSDVKYVPLDDWLESKLKKGELKTISLDNFGSILDNYYENHGTRRKVFSFFETYYEKTDLESLSKSLKRIHKDPSRLEELDNINELIAFVEDNRNLFIHRATNIDIPSEKLHEERAQGYAGCSGSLLTYINGKGYMLDMSTMHIEGLLDGFEKGIIKYFSN